MVNICRLFFLYLLLFFLLPRNILGQGRKRSSGTTGRCYFLLRLRFLTAKLGVIWGVWFSAKQSQLRAVLCFLLLFFLLVYKLNSARQNFSFLQWAVAVSKWQPIFTVLFIISCFLKIQKRFSKVSGVGGLNCHIYSVSLSFFQV